jgi:hypothetical protein
LAAHIPGQVMPAGLLLTVPALALPDMLTYNGWTGVKLAVAFCGEFIVTMHAPVPEQDAEDHPAKADPGEGFAVRITFEPVVKFAVQVAPQLMPVGELVTVPLPVPDGDTVRP